MTRTLVALAFSMLFAPRADSGLPQTGPTEEKPRITFFWSDYGLLAPKRPSGGRQAVERETRSIFAEAGIEVSFRLGSPEDEGDGTDPVAPVRIVLMPRSAENWGLPANAMGAILDRTPYGGTLYVFVPVVERTIRRAVDRDKMPHDGRKGYALARALARVLAHETVHAIDPDIPHGPEGSVMSENLTSPLLLGHRLSFDGTTKTRLLETLLKRATTRIPHL